MLIEERYKDEVTGSEEVNSLPKLELLSYLKRQRNKLCDSVTLCLIKAELHGI